MDKKKYKNLELPTINQMCWSKEQPNHGKDHTSRDRDGMPEGKAGHTANAKTVKIEFANRRMFFQGESEAGQGHVAFLRCHDRVRSWTITTTSKHLREGVLSGLLFL